MLIKLWNWEKSWACQMTFEGHTHYVMQVVFNPKDNNTFASASLDRTIKASIISVTVYTVISWTRNHIWFCLQVWQLGSSTSNFTLEGHEKGINCIDYYHGGDKPYLISGADDRLVKIWDYQNKTCVQTLEGHSFNISSGEDSFYILLPCTHYMLIYCCVFSVFPSRTTHLAEWFRRRHCTYLAFRYLSLRIFA